MIPRFIINWNKNEKLFCFFHTDMTRCNWYRCQWPSMSSATDLGTEHVLWYSPTKYLQNNCSVNNSYSGSMQWLHLNTTNVQLFITLASWHTCRWLLHRKKMWSFLWSSIKVVLIAALAASVLPVDDLCLLFYLGKPAGMWAWCRNVKMRTNSLVVGNKNSVVQGQTLPLFPRLMSVHSTALERGGKREVSTSYIFWSWLLGVFFPFFF